MKPQLHLPQPYSPQPPPLPLKGLSNLELLLNTKKSAQAEQLATQTLIQHLAEVERRSAYAQPECPEVYSSLFDYIHRGLHYSESQAAERVAATRLLLQVPSVAESFTNQKLTLTTAAQIQRFVQRERQVAHIRHDVSSLIKKVEGLSKREVELHLQSIAHPSTLSVMRESARPSPAPQKVQVRAEVDQALWARANELLTEPSIGDLLEKALQALIEKQEKRKGISPARPAKSASSQSPTPPAKESSSPEPQSVATKPSPRLIPISIRRLIHARADGRCEFKNQQGHRCTQTQQLEFDHIRPVRLGGDSTAQNLRLYCRVHNQARNH